MTSSVGRILQIQLPVMECKFCLSSECIPGHLSCMHHATYIFCLRTSFLCFRKHFPLGAFRFGPLRPFIFISIVEGAWYSSKDYEFRVSLCLESKPVLFPAADGICSNVSNTNQVGLDLCFGSSPSCCLSSNIPGIGSALSSLIVSATQGAVHMYRRGHVAPWWHHLCDA